MCTQVGGNITSRCMTPQVTDGPALWLPVGDSITDGVGDDVGLGGYPGRVSTYLVSDTLPNFCNFGLIGSNTVGAGTPYAWNFAFSGQTIQKFYPSTWDPSGEADLAGGHDVAPQLAPTDTTRTPTVVTEMLGRNNILSAAAVPIALGYLTLLLKYMLSVAPNVRIGVCQVIPHVADQENGWTTTFNDGLPGVIADVLAAYPLAKIRIINTNTGIVWIRATGPAGDFFDDGHPNANGYTKISALLNDELPTLFGYDLAV